MIPYLGDFAEDETVYIYFNTFDSNDPSASVTATDLIASDIFVYKDGSVTDLVTDGASVTIDFDSRTGVHKIEIDTSAHADYATGSDYMVCVVGVTVDAGNINSAIACFSIENRYSAGALRPTTAGRTLDVTATGAAGIDWGNVENKTTANDLSGTDIQLVDTATTVTNQHTLAAIADAIWDETMAGHSTADTAGLLMNEWQDGGRLDLILDIIAADTTTDIPALIAALDVVVDRVETDTQDLQTQLGAAGAGLTAVPWNAAWDAEVESEVNDALDTAISELGVAAPTATPTIRTALMLMYMALRNKTVVQTSGTDALEIYNDAGTKIASKLLTDDGSDYTEAEMS